QLVVLDRPFRPTGDSAHRHLNLRVLRPPQSVAYSPAERVGPLEARIGLVDDVVVRAGQASVLGLAANLPHVRSRAVGILVTQLDRDFAAGSNRDALIVRRRRGILARSV